MRKGLKIVGFVALGALFLGLFGWVTMSLWNWLVPALFTGPVITFWQAVGLLALSKILFSGFGKGGCHRGYQGRWRGKMYEKFSNMTPEEREAFKKKMNERWCRSDRNTSAQKTDDSNV